MTPFKRSQLDWQGRSVKERIKGIQEQNHAMGVSCTWKKAKMQYQRLASDEIWVNDKYQVNIDRSIVSNNTSWIPLSIKTHNKEPARDWREFQQIKNELVGPEHEGIELYPADSRVVDTSNQFGYSATPYGGLTAQNLATNPFNTELIRQAGLI